jgi:putative DNA primase/helicase
MRPIHSLEDLGNAACDAALLIRGGDLSTAQAGDDLWDMAVGSGLLDKYGPETVQAAIGSGLRTIVNPELNDASAPSNGGPAARQIEDELDARALEHTSTLPRVAAIGLERFLKMNIPPRTMMLTPWLPTQGLAMVHAPRGTGKTRMVHGVAYAIGTGSGFLRWTAPQPKRVLLLDGEMPAATLQEMLRATTQASQRSLPEPDFFRIAAADLAPDGLPDLANPAAQQFYADIVADADLVVGDNLSTLCRSLKENDADSWTPVQSWALSLRRAGKSLLWIHHDGKSGNQRGTTRKEDVLDTVIALRRPPDYLAEQGARFEVHFEKSRGFHGPDAEPFETRLLGDQWAISPIKTGDDLATIQALRKQGLSIRDIADRTGIPKSTVQDRLNGEE